MRSGMLNVRYDSQPPTKNSMAPDSPCPITWVSSDWRTDCIPCAVKPGRGLVKEPAHKRNLRSDAKTSMSKNTLGTAHLDWLPYILPQNQLSRLSTGIIMASLLTQVLIVIFGRLSMIHEWKGGGVKLTAQEGRG